MSLAPAFSIVLFALVTAACSDKRPIPGMGKDSSALILPTDSFPPHEHDTVDPPKGSWETGAVPEALEAAGLGPVSYEGTVRLRFLGPVGTRLRVPGAEIQVYIYADALARARETDLIDSVKVAPVNGHADWTMPPSIIVVNNVALIVLTRDEFLRRRIHAAVREHPVSAGR